MKKKDNSTPALDSTSPISSIEQVREAFEKQTTLKFLNKEGHVEDVKFGEVNPVDLINSNLSVQIVPIANDKMTYYVPDPFQRLYASP